ncbi:choice-of-anchor A family protein [Streptomyces sp. NPDC048507]|uniref:choice-of-anchor A family protein n=1 Tax=Streptomyces sp. NPDC048507 TaxID=3365560 RepID=UPI003719A5B5
MPLTTTTTRTSARVRGAVALGLVLGLAAPCTAFAAPLTPRTPAAGQSPSCPAPGKEPGIGPNPLFTDSNVALYAGGDYTADGGTAEAEGLVVVRGNATFAKTAGGVFNIGRVGAGSGILPASGSVMLAVGGNLAIAKGTTVDVGHGLTAGPRYGGSVQVGGAIDAKGPLETNGGSRSAGAGARAALSPYDTFADTIRDESAALAALGPTGKTVRSGQTVTFTGGADTAGPQVFEIPAKELDGASTFLFTAIFEKDSVVVNVTGGQAVGIAPLSAGFNGDRVDVYGSARFGEAASRTLFNFRDSVAVNLSGGGNFMGSVLAPKATADITASTNGRLYIGGNLRTHGSGNESHNYPWRDSSVFGCTPTPPKPGPGTPTTPAPQPPTSTPTAPSPGPTKPGPSGTRPGTHPTPTGSRPAGPATPAPSPTPSPGGPHGSLATTGAEVTVYILLAVVLAAIGVAAVVVSRRKRG